MLKKIVTIIFATALTLGMIGSAFAAFADLELIRIYYDRAGAEIATDLGNVNSLVTSGGKIAGSFGSLSTGYIAYFALDRTTNQLWASGSTTTPSVVVGSATGLTSMKSGTTNFYSLAITQGGTDYTGLASAVNSYRARLSATGQQGSLGNAINTTTRANTEASLTSLIGATSGSIIQNLYFWANGNATTATGKIGVVAATITTNFDGSTTISAPPPDTTVTATAGTGGVLDATTPSPKTVTQGFNTTFKYNADTNYYVSGTSGCNGPAYSNSDQTILTYTYSTGAITGDCTVNATFATITSTTPTDQTIGTITFNPATLAVGGTTQPSATATSGLAVSFTSTTPAVCTVSGTTVTGVTAGTCTIAANQAGDTSFNAAPQVTQDIIVDTVGKTGQTIGAISFNPSTLAVGGTASASATATSGLAITFSSATPAVCTVSGSTVTGVNEGTCTINANQAGNANYNSASQVTQSITTIILPISFTVFSTTDPPTGANGSISPATNQVKAGDKAIFTVTADSNSGYQIAAVTGCGGTLSGNTYTTAAILRDCTVTATFIAKPALKGDLKIDGKIDVADALLALQFAIGLKTPSPKDIAAGDVAPFVNGTSAPDGKIDIADAVAILQKSVGLLSW